MKADDDPDVQKAKKKQQLIQNLGAEVVFLAVIGGVAWWMMRKPADDGPAVQPGNPAAQPVPAPGAEAVIPAGAAPAGAGPANAAGAAGVALPM